MKFSSHQSPDENDASLDWPQLLQDGYALMRGPGTYPTPGTPWPLPQALAVGTVLGTIVPSKMGLAYHEAHRTLKALKSGHCCQPGVWPF